MGYLSVILLKIKDFKVLNILFRLVRQVEDNSNIHKKLYHVRYFERKVLYKNCTAVSKVFVNAHEARHKQLFFSESAQTVIVYQECKVTHCHPIAYTLSAGKRQK